jgi:hypothetical protein
MLRIIHTADVHLGARHDDLGEQAAAQRERQFAAFKTTVDLALTEKADVFLIAGDLFDSNVQPRRSVERVAAELKRLAEGKVYLPERAQENVERLKEAVSVQLERSYNKVERTKQMLQVAAEVVRLRTEGDRIAENQMTQGVVLVSARRQATVSSKASLRINAATTARIQSSRRGLPPWHGSMAIAGSSAGSDSGDMPMTCIIRA